jgi:hypothetical protein
VGTPELSVSELHYHPADPTAAELAAGWLDADEFEFIELVNSGRGTFDLNGVRFITGIRFDFTTSAITRLPTGACLLVVKSRAAFEQRYGTGFPIAGEYTGQLDNAGERITLVGPQDETLLDFTYGTWAPWPALADGQGPSLELADPNANPGLPEAWRASPAAGGSPGNPSSLPPLALQLASLENGRLRLRFEGRAGSGYTVYARDAVATGSWQTLQQYPPLAQTQTVEIDLDLPDSPSARFFQVSIP